MSNSQPYLGHYGIQPHEIKPSGFFEPQYLIIKADHQLNVWQAITDWLRDHGGKPPALNLSDPYDRMTAQALIVREHELAHFSAFLVNPFATTIQRLGAARDLYVLKTARLLRESGETRLVLPLKSWQRNYRIDSSTALQIQDLEAKIQGCEALLGMLLFGLTSLPIPARLRDDSSSRTFWPWVLISEQIQKAGVERINVRDLQEGLAVIAEMRALSHLGVSPDDFLKLRGGLYGEYRRVPEIIVGTLGGWFEMTAGIAMSAAIMFPAVAVLLKADDWPRFDASTCLFRVLDGVVRIGPLLKFLEVNSPVDGYIRKIFESSYPGFDPAALLDQSNLARIEAAFGIDELRSEALDMALLPSIHWLNRAQNEIALELPWERRFLPLPLGGERWWPPIIWFSDRLGRFTDLKTYTSTRMGFILHRIAHSLYHCRDVQAAEEICYGGVNDGDSSRAGAVHVLDELLQH